jgi:hypothetical protein
MKKYDSDGFLIRDKSQIGKTFLYNRKWYKITSSKVKYSVERFHCEGLYHKGCMKLFVDEIKDYESIFNTTR